MLQLHCVVLSLELPPPSMSMATMAASSSSSGRAWRTAFLTLRDEALTTPPRTDLLHTLIFSPLPSLIAAAPDLPPHEVTSDLLFLLDLVANTSTPHISKTCDLIECISRRATLELNASSWTLLLDSFRKIVDCLLGKPASNGAVSGNAKPLMDSLETIRYLIDRHERKCYLAENLELVKFLLHLVTCFHAELGHITQLSADQKYGAESGKRMPRYCSSWEVQTVTFNMLGQVLSRVGPSLPVDIWKSTVEVFRKVMDVLASKTLLVEDILMSRFYASLLHCLHLVLVDMKSSLSDHVSSFVAALRMFFIYGLTSRPQQTYIAGMKEKEVASTSRSSSLGETTKGDHGRYIPPHLRKKESLSIKLTEAWDSQRDSANASSTLDFASSDSDYSDSDGSLKDAASVQNCKVRVAAIMCIQDLCQADPKSFTSQWTLLLPTNDVLQPRKFEATLMSCLLFDPHLKARVASASTLAVMLDGPSSVFLQVAEYKESTKRGSFTALSSSLGQILMQLHSGVLYLIQRETHCKLLPSLFKILRLLIPSTPYSRMPEELLPNVISSLQARIEDGFPGKIDQAGLLAATISCLTTALSISPPSPQVKEMFSKEISTGFVDAKKKAGVLTTLFQYSERISSPTVCIEALQAIRAVCHNYPNIMSASWERTSTTVYEILRAGSPEALTTSWRGHVGNTLGVSGEKVIMGAVKVLDECLRALSGFKGTEDLFDDKLLDAPFTSDCRRMKKVSSAPSHEPEFAEDTNGGLKAYQLGSEPWSEAIEKHIPLVLRHTSAMVRTASLTCFAGLTSPTFNSLAKEKQGFILSSMIDAAVNDDGPTVRSAACRAIGVISCFQQIYASAEILDKFVHAVEINTRDPAASLRITASWALANICDSLRHCIGNFSSEKLTNSNSQSIALLVECALRLTKDGDKVKSNAVRALGNLARLVNCACLPAIHGKSVHETGLSSARNHTDLLTSSSNRQGSCASSPDPYCPVSLTDSHLPERMVQAFVSCVTTGNVKVQWNVCHALSNLFLNKTMRLQDMDWAPSVFSILILLLRDSSNFKIRIQAAAALAVPASVHDYGTSFTDVVQGLEHILENFSSDQISAPSSFKYRIALEKQLTSTILHVLSLASGTDQEPLKDFLVKKASFLEEWLRSLCSSLEECGVEDGSVRNQKKEIISKAIQSLIQVYRGRNHHTITQKFDKLEEMIR